MQIKMLVSISQSDGFSATIGQRVEVADDLAREMLADGRAEYVDAPKPKKIIQTQSEPVFRKHPQDGGTVLLGNDAPVRKAQKAVE